MIQVAVLPLELCEIGLGIGFGAVAGVLGGAVGAIGGKILGVVASRLASRGVLPAARFVASRLGVIDAASGLDSQFSSAQTLAGHFADHGTDFGASSPAAYERQTSRFLGGRPGPGVLEKTRTSGDVVRFDPFTNQFGILSARNIIRTYYRPDPLIRGYVSNLEYFNAQ